MMRMKAYLVHVLQSNFLRCIAGLRIIHRPGPILKLNVVTYTAEHSNVCDNAITHGLIYKWPHRTTAAPT